MNPLAVVPTFMRGDDDIRLVRKCLATMSQTAPDLDIMVVDDCSPRRDLAEELAREVHANGHEMVIGEANEGFSRTVNVGLRTAHSEGRDALLVNADVEFFEEGWLRAMQDTDAYVVGAQLIFPNGLLQHAGVYYSVLHRIFDHRYRFAPASLPEANVECVCPVTAALSLVRHEALTWVGLYDEAFRMGWEDVDYGIRVFETGRQCVYQPKARAIHYENMFRKDAPLDSKLSQWTRDSYMHLFEKHAGKSFAEYVPTMLEDPQ